MSALESGAGDSFAIEECKDVLGTELKARKITAGNEGVITAINDDNPGWTLRIFIKGKSYGCTTQHA